MRLCVGLAVLTAVGVMARGRGALGGDAFALPIARLPDRARPGRDSLDANGCETLVTPTRDSRVAPGLATLFTLIELAVDPTAGDRGGPVDDVPVRLVGALPAVPALLLALAVAGAVGPGSTELMLGLSSVWWAGYARVVRGLARALGATDAADVRRHVPPATLPGAAALPSLEMGDLMLAMSGSSFLGFGARPTAARGGRARGRRPLAVAVAVAVVCLGGCAAERPGRDPGVLVAALDADPGHLNPAITTNGGLHTAAGLLYDGLLTLDGTLAPRPALAERWEVLDGGTRYRFHLRRGVRWHDGQPFTAADVQFTFDSLLLRFHARTRASLGPALLGVDAVDDSTVQFRFRRPYAPLLQQLDVVEAPILPRHLFAGRGDPLRNPANTAPVGTGPFRFVSSRPGAEIRYAANTQYFGGAPALREVVLRVIPDAGTRVVALEAGEVDWLFAVPGPERARLRGDRRIVLLPTTINPGGSNCITTLGFNLDRPSLRDVRVRRAVAHAVNRPQFVERVLFGEGRAADAPISSRIPFAYAAGLPVPAYDTARSARLLHAAGWRREGSAVRTALGVPGVADGTPFVVRFKVLPSQADYGDLLRAQLRSVGIDLRVQPLEQAVFAQTVFTARDFDAAIAAYCNGTDPEIGVRRQYVSASVAPVPFSNMAGYRNPAMDSLFDRAGAALDHDERRTLYRAIQEIAVRDQPYVWLVETVATRAHTARCRGFGTSSHFAATATCTR